MNNYTISIIAVLLGLCLGGLVYLGWSNWQLRQEIAALQETETVTEPSTAPAPGQGTAPGTDPFFDNFFPDNFFSGNRDFFAEMEQVREEMRKMMQQGRGQTFTFQSVQPDISLEETNDAYVVNIAIPEGRDIELNTEVDGNQFVVSGKVSSQTESGQGNARQSIVASSSFSRSFTLDEPVDTLGMARETRGDALVITLPKAG